MNLINHDIKIWRRIKNFILIFGCINTVMILNLFFYKDEINISLLSIGIIIDIIVFISNFKINKYIEWLANIIINSRDIWIVQAMAIKMELTGFLSIYEITQDKWYLDNICYYDISIKNNLYQLSKKRVYVYFNILNYFKYCKYLKNKKYIEEQEKNMTQLKNDLQLGLEFTNIIKDDISNYNLFLESKIQECCNNISEITNNLSKENSSI